MVSRTCRVFEEHITSVSLLFDDWENGNFRDIGYTLTYWLQNNLILLPFTARLIKFAAQENFTGPLRDLLDILYVIGVDDYCKIGLWFVNQHDDILLQFEPYGIQDI